MTIQLISYGIARDIVGSKELSYTLPDHASVADLLTKLASDYPTLAGLVSLKVAVNGSYAAAAQEISEKDEVVLIPPVSGG
ncbi:MAG: MoaD/ThiS family protein [Bacteroidota bacterium]